MVGGTSFMLPGSTYKAREIDLSKRYLNNMFNSIKYKLGDSSGIPMGSECFKTPRKNARMP